MSQEQTNQAAAVKPDPAAAAKTNEGGLTIKVINVQLAETVFKIKKTTKLWKVMDSYRQKEKMLQGDCNFTFDGHILLWDKALSPTAGDLEMEDGDIIEFTVRQDGGAGSF